MTKILRTFEAKVETYAKFKSLLVGRGENIGDKFNEFMESFILQYGDKTNSLDSYIIDPNFIPTPPFPLQQNVHRTKWVENIESHKGDEKYLKDLVWSSQTIGSLSQKMLDHGTTSVRIHH